MGDYKTEQEWRIWIQGQGHIFQELPFPRAALIDRRHFDCFIVGYEDLLEKDEELQAFDSRVLNDQEAMKMLIALDEYAPEPLNTWLLRELRERFNLPCDFEDDGETWPAIPPQLIDDVLGKSKK